MKKQLPLHRPTLDMIALSVGAVSLIWCVMDKIPKSKR